MGAARTAAGPTDANARMVVVNLDHGSGWSPISPLTVRRWLRKPLPA